MTDDGGQTTISNLKARIQDAGCIEHESWRNTAGSGQEAADSKRSEVGGQRSEDRRQRTDDRGQTTDDRISNCEFLTNLPFDHLTI